MENDFTLRMQQYRTAIEHYLNICFSQNDLPQKRLFESMRYSLLAGGKRIRPILTLEFSRLCCGRWEQAIPFAAALEMVHTYSLIHDDLPCMDNDDYRRGRLTNHKVFGEDTAVLSGDALLTAAFGIIASSELDAETRIAAVGILSSCAGELGMVGGQILDMEGESRKLCAEEVYGVHRLKTGCLISAACQLGVLAGHGGEERRKAAEKYAHSLGLAFQIRDDILDLVGDEKKLGKATHADVEKTTFASLFGVEKCEEMVRQETKQALDALSCFEEAHFLRELTMKLADRDH